MQIPYRDYFSFLATYLRGQGLRLFWLNLLLFAGIGLQLINPLILREFIDAALAQASMSSLLAAAVLFLAVAIVIQIISVATVYVSENIAWRATNSLRVDLVKHCIDLDLSFHSKHSPGEMIERIDGDVTMLANFFSQLVIRVVGNLLLLLGVLAILVSIDWRVAAALALFMLLTLLVTNYTRHLSVPYWSKARQASANLFSFLEEQLAGTEDVRANGARSYTMRSLFALMRERLQSERKAVLMLTAVLSTSRFLMTFGTGLAFALGTYFFTQQTISIGTVYLIYQYTEMLRQPLETILFQIEDLQKASASIVRTKDLLQARSALHDGQEQPSQSGAAALSFDAVSFGYTPDQKVLDRISFQLEAGRVLGVLGRTGSGKTTLSRLIFRFYDPSEGAIRLNQTDLRQIRRDELNQQIGLVTQDVQLFQASVRDNLTFFNPQISDQQITSVIDHLGLSAWFGRFPQGLDSQIGPSGAGLSAGEAQLLTFVRVFLKQPSLIVLDEASARLDPHSERLMEQAVDRLLAGQTAIIIAHRLSTIERADQILILDQGQIIEYGPRQALERDPSSHYARLIATGLQEVTA
jgi:ATP-binding cassette subfamily B protein